MERLARRRTRVMTQRMRAAAARPRPMWAACAALLGVACLPLHAVTATLSDLTASLKNSRPANNTEITVGHFSERILLWAGQTSLAL